MIPAVIVLEGELTGAAGRVPIHGMDDCTERSEQSQRSISSLW